MSQPQTNGVSDGGKYIDSINPDDPEYVRQLRRPAEVKEDMQQMEDRLRVSKILQSQAFRDELEHMIDEQMQNGPNPTALLALQQISELVLPQAKGSVGGVLGKVTASIIPINDIRGTDQLSYVKGEKILRCRLASCFRLVDLFGWSSGYKSLITMRINQEEEHFLTSPHGLMFHEVTASSLKKVNMQGDEVDPGSTNLAVNKDGLQLHAAIHSFRPDIKCIIHIRCPSAVSVSAMTCGLLPMSHEAIICGEASIYDYTGSISGEEESDKIARTMGPNNKLMILRNFGFIVGGESIEEAFHYAFNLMIACESQLRAAPLGLDNIHIPSEEIRAKAFEAANQPIQHEEGRKKWRRGEIEFEGLMRHLDNCGYRTGHLYREPNLKRTERRDRANDEVEIPPTTSSFAYMYDDKTPVKQVYDRQKKVFKCEWLNTPNAYKKEEIPEIGTPKPKTITKWVPENSPNKSSNPIRVETANQFAPISENDKEFRQKHQAIRKEYYTEKITAGPTSKILDGMSWDEAQRLKEGAGASDSVIVVGAASKGIIQRDHQHNAVVYKTHYAPNPFDNMSEDDIASYKKDVEAKATGGAGTVNGEQQLASPTKSTSSGEGAYDSQREGSPIKDLPEQASPSKEKKKKKGFRMPSFSKKKDKK